MDSSLVVIVFAKSVLLSVLSNALSSVVAVTVAVIVIVIGPGKVAVMGHVQAWVVRVTMERLERGWVQVVLTSVVLTRVVVIMVVLQGRYCYQVLLLLLLLLVL